MISFFCRSLGFILFLLILPVITMAADTLKMGVLPVVDTLPLWVGLTEKDFEHEGINLEMVSFESALERDASFQSGNLDGYFGDLLNTILLIRSGQELKMITTAYHTHPDFRMFGIAVSPGSDIKTPDKLQGLSIGISRATVIEFLLDRMLLQQNLKTDSISRQDIKKMPIRLQMLLANQIPAALLPEPLLTLAESKGARIITDDRSLDTAETVLAIRTKWADADRSRISRFLAAYQKTVTRINQNPDNYKDILVKHTRFPMPVKDQFRIPVFPDISLPSVADVAAVQDWLIETGVTDSRTDYNRMVHHP